MHDWSGRSGEVNVARRPGPAFAGQVWKRLLADVENARATPPSAGFVVITHASQPEDHVLRVVLRRGRLVSKQVGVERSGDLDREPTRMGIRDISSGSRPIEIVLEGILAHLKRLAGTVLSHSTLQPLQMRDDDDTVEPLKAQRGFRRLRPPGSLARMTESIDELWAPTMDELNRFRMLAEQCGFASQEIPRSPSAAHAGIVVDETDFVVLSLEFGAHSNPHISSGVLRDITADEPTALEACNARTRSRPSHPCFLARADGPLGADVIIQQSFPSQLLFETPGFFKYCIESLPDVVRDARERLLGQGLGGYPFRWTEQDAQRVATRAM